MKIYTKTGDTGETSLFGGARVRKNSLRIESYGTVDELNAVLGIALTYVDNPEIKVILVRLQNELFTLGSDLAAPLDKGNKGFVIPRVEEDMITTLERDIDDLTDKLPELRNFILPGGRRGASYLHFARTVCRRAERAVTALAEQDDIGGYIIKYINRLSDLLFVLARYENHVNGTPDIAWQK